MIDTQHCLSTCYISNTFYLLTTIFVLGHDINIFHDLRLDNNIHPTFLVIGNRTELQYSSLHLSKSDLDNVPSNITSLIFSISSKHVRPVFMLCNRLLYFTQSLFILSSLRWARTPTPREAHSKLPRICFFNNWGCSITRNSCHTF